MRNANPFDLNIKNRDKRGYIKRTKFKKYLMQKDASIILNNVTCVDSTEGYILICRKDVVVPYKGKNMLATTAHVFYSSKEQ